MQNYFQLVTEISRLSNVMLTVCDSLNGIEARLIMVEESSRKAASVEPRTIGMDNKLTNVDCRVTNMEGMLFSIAQHVSVAVNANTQPVEVIKGTVDEVQEDLEQKLPVTTTAITSAICSKDDYAEKFKDRDERLVGYMLCPHHPAGAFEMLPANCRAFEEHGQGRRTFKNFLKSIFASSGIKDTLTKDHNSSKTSTGEKYSPLVLKTVAEIIFEELFNSRPDLQYCKFLWQPFAVAEEGEEVPSKPNKKKRKHDDLVPVQRAQFLGLTMSFDILGIKVLQEEVYSFAKQHRNYDQKLSKRLFREQSISSSTSSSSSSPSSSSSLTSSSLPIPSSLSSVAMSKKTTTIPVEKLRRLSKMMTANNDDKLCSSNKSNDDDNNNDDVNDDDDDINGGDDNHYTNRDIKDMFQDFGSDSSVSDEDIIRRR
eukprot:scaffold1492_cov144-Ochromonas_danica.AAC.2